MKLGFGFYRHMLDEVHYRFARQCGATHAVVHLTDYFRDGEEGRSNQPVGATRWGVAGGSDAFWSVEYLKGLREDMARHGLELTALENFDPAHWYDVLLGGPKRDAQIAHLQQIVRNVGAAGIATIGYNFSIAGVSSRVTDRYARGDAMSVGMEAVDDTPIPNGMVWNMVYDQDAPDGDLSETTHEQLWDRLTYFLEKLVPVAEEAGVRLAAHPDDPPAPFVRGQPRLVYQPSMYRRLADIRQSRSNALEFCLGSIAEMTEGDIYETTRHHAERGEISYVHFRNIVGKVPTYRETFVDDGDIDMARIVGILSDAGFDGVLIPDHTPLMECDAPWHAGMAYACGYMQALLQDADRRKIVN